MVTPAEHFSSKNRRDLRPGSDEAGPEERTVLVNVVLGMPLHRCQYHGICRIELEDAMQEPCRHRRIRTRLEHNGERLRARFGKQGLRPETVKKHFASGNFIVLADFALPEFLQSFFRTPLVIRRGIYPVQETEDAYLVDF